ncbi:CAZyme family GH16 [Penicillium roqueforti]|uniref:endo-1,3(4)-beta-glucanase n=1 Tax=Penicillium roqueforti (strain FM164) TaxID=1365484 RepID=W6PT91_PENRF|nr:CAZyme family GH16 [Penicillium roqueforti]CDM27100.1 Concanavalin A-like lectin/glucanase [Penicillium roqueforti FM164]KAF9249675.1 CAZyme family GH16 [Penicillium roqueforti]KAI1835218.1 CAZyme family GH16 [Penicillium roqueforti]KAI2677231.1 CAZyme family GH16 [Penicillium roqueforti]KAI2688472.1 CAZyme family GH16 [Penicillium roqueforti]
MQLFSALLPTVGLLAQVSSAAYTLRDDYGTTDSFFDKFNFYTDTDPTNGFVSYVDRNTASGNGLLDTSNGIYIGVDHSNTASTPGRQSVRLESTTTYKHGLVILDLAHMPSSTCGTWPAFWMLGSNWPNNGEIDIIEGVNEQTQNQMALHTSDGCTINNGGFTGTLDTANCYVQASGQSSNSGCSIQSDSTQSYGTGFNNVGGGVYATEWTGSAISVWFFPSNAVPADISSGTPNPAGWGTPTALFSGGCDIDSHFNDLQIVFDITFCGDWAGSVWGSSSCASYAASCVDFVQNNPTAFQETYWSVRSLKVYQDLTSSTSGAEGDDEEVDADWNSTASYERSVPRSSMRHRRQPNHHRHGHA